MFEKVKSIGHIEPFLATKSMKIGDTLLLHVGTQNSLYESGVYAVATIISEPYILKNQPDDYCNEKLTIDAKITSIDYDTPLINSENCALIFAQKRTVHQIKGNYLNILSNILNIEGISSEQLYYEKYYQSEMKKFLVNDKKRLQFINEFPVLNIKNLSLEQYVVGKNSHNSFCYWLETTLRPLGSIKGGSPADKKFGIYYSKDNESYNFLTNRWGSTPNVAYNNIREELNHLLKVGADYDLAGIAENKLSPMFKNKILSTYYPDLYLNVFAPEHVEHFLNKLNIPFDTSSSVESKRDLLLQYKQNNQLMKNWNNFIFSDYLYKIFDPKELSSIISEVEIEQCLNAEDPNACYVTQMKLVKERKVNQKIVKDLKKKYNGVCQICGINPVETYGVSILEGHHIEYFSMTQNNSPQNIILICPNCHSLIHKLNPLFDKKNLNYRLPDGNILELKYNKPELFMMIQN